MTLDYVEIDPINIFANGQLYTALSRVKTLKGLSLKHPIQRHYIKTNDKVTAFLKRYEK
jgi:hypothetical protein